MNTKDYPLGADNEQAPWNQKPRMKVPIDATLSVVISTDITVDIECDFDENGQPIVLKECVEDAASYLAKELESKGWTIDDYNVELD